MLKAKITNLIALLIFISGYLLQSDLLLMTGLFALSGALTNWLAIHMLFEKVPGLYGSGVIPNRFEEFKETLHQLLMSQFFSSQQIDQFISAQTHNAFNLKPVIETIDLSPTYDKLVQTIMNSSFGSMLGMFGGSDALTPLREPFLSNLKEGLIEITESDHFHALVQQHIDQPDHMQNIQTTIDSMIQDRLNQLTPELVKSIVQELIQQHLGWLVVWGGLFGGLIGLFSSLVLSA